MPVTETCMVSSPQNLMHCAQGPEHHVKCRCAYLPNPLKPCFSSRRERSSQYTCSRYSRLPSLLPASTWRTSTCHTNPWCLSFVTQTAGCFDRPCKQPLSPYQQPSSTLPEPENVLGQPWEADKVLAASLFGQSMTGAAAGHSMLLASLPSRPPCVLTEIMTPVCVTPSGLSLAGLCLATGSLTLLPDVQVWTGRMITMLVA